MSEILDWLQFLTDGRETLGGKKPKDWHYVCMEDFVLREGREYDELSTYNYQLGPIKQCFNNAYKLVQRSKRNLRYVEGYAASIITVHHAWVVDEEDRIIETTWDTPGTGYVGVVFPLDYVAGVRKRTRQHSVIDNYIERWPLLRQPFDPASL